MKHIMAWIECEKGVTGVEYGIIGSGIGFALLLGATFFGESFNVMMDTFSDYLGGDTSSRMN